MIRRLLVGKRVLQIPLPGGVLREGKAFDCLPLCIQFKQALCHFLYRFLGALFHPGPFVAAEFRQARGAFLQADIALEEVNLVGGYIEPVFAGITNIQVVLGAIVHLQGLDAQVLADAVVNVDHIVPNSQFLGRKPQALFHLGGSGFFPLASVELQFCEDGKLKTGKLKTGLQAAGGDHTAADLEFVFQFINVDCGNIIIVEQFQKAPAPLLG